jgi:hypothetical protein
MNLDEVEENGLYTSSRDRISDVIACPLGSVPKARSTTTIAKSPRNGTQVTAPTRTRA